MIGFRPGGMEWITAIVDDGGTPPEYAAQNALVWWRAIALATIRQHIALRSVKGPLRQASPALDPSYDASARRPGRTLTDEFESHSQFVKGLDKFLLHCVSALSGW
jgi:hypothetical protein